MEVLAPAPEAVDQKPVETVPTVEPKVETPNTVATKEQFELPDGTKVDAEGLSKAWRDNFMPEYTRKSQELAAIKSKPTTPVPGSGEPKEAPWQNPAWEPKTYQELAESLQAQTEQKVWKQIMEESTRVEREQAERDSYISQEVEQLKALDPKVNVSSIMAHASKYAFPSLIPAYQNMKAIEEAERRVEERVLKNMKQRAGEPVGVGAADPNAGVVFPPGVRTGYEKAKWILN